MKILAISQVYWPDTASVSQHLTDLLEALVECGSEVTVISSRNDYESPEKRYSQAEVQNNVKIIRVWGTRFGKGTKIGRVIDFFTFYASLSARLISFNKANYDVLLGLTAPPLVSYLGAIIAKFKQKMFIYWTMDLQPELSIVAGYINENSMAAKSLQRKGDYVFNNSDLIITLDKYMKRHIENRLRQKVKMQVIPVWPVMSDRYTGNRMENPFRLEHGFEDKIVIMYSGNHSVMHPITTLLDAAVLLKNDSRFLFVHIGGGVRLSEVKQYQEEHELENVMILPYQPRDQIKYSLGSADIQVVTMGNDSVGYAHPNKIYGSMFIGKPMLYIGPSQSHASDILSNCEGNIIVEHGESHKLVNALTQFAEEGNNSKNLIGKTNQAFAERHFHPAVLLKRMVTSIESVAHVE